MTIKILHVYKTYYPETFGGVEHVIASLAKGLVKDGFVSEVFCLSAHETKIDDVDGITVQRIKSDVSFASTPLALKAFKKFKERVQQFDMIHYHFPYPFADILHALKGVNKPTVVTYHSDIVKQKLIYPLYKPLMNRFLKSVDHIVATSPAYLATSPVLMHYKDKTTVIPIGIDESAYPIVNNVAVEDYKKQFGDRFFAFIGVLRYYKGLHVLIEAVRHSDIQIVIAGSGPSEASLKQQASGLSNVHFLGAISELEKVNLLHACYGFVFPSHLRSEAFGISLLEASLFAKPMISCEIGTGTSYVNEDKVTGYVIEPHNVLSLKNAMNLLLDNSEIAQEMGVESKKRYQELFMASHMAKSYGKIYDSVLCLRNLREER